ncbi:MAG: hypothetical protein SGPRY_006198 [Prymnesium sp.]
MAATRCAALPEIAAGGRAGEEACEAGGGEECAHPLLAEQIERSSEEEDAEGDQEVEGGEDEREEEEDEEDDKGKEEEGEEDAGEEDEEDVCKGEEEAAAEVEAEGDEEQADVLTELEVVAAAASASVESEAPPFATAVSYSCGANGTAAHVSQATALHLSGEVSLPKAGDEAESSESDSSSDWNDSSEDQAEDKGAAEEPEKPATRPKQKENEECGSDNEGAVGWNPPKTKNEISAEDEQVPELTISLDASTPVEDVASVSSIMGTTIVMQASLTLPPRRSDRSWTHIASVPSSQAIVGSPPLAEGSVLCVRAATSEEAPVLLGPVAEVFGPVKRPMYLLRFADEALVDRLGLDVGTMVCCALPHSDFLVRRAWACSHDVLPLHSLLRALHIVTAL